MKLFASLRRTFNWQDWLALVTGVGAALALGLSQITRGSIWFDEAFSEHITRHSFFDIARYTAVDVHPPLYYWALKIWRSLFGSSELALRSMSLFFLALTMVAAYVLVRKYFTRRAAMLTMLLLAASPMLFRYGIEARMYTMEAFIAVAATGVLLSVRRTGNKKSWVLYGVLVGLGLLTHYLSAIIWLAHAVWLYAQMTQKSFKLTVQKIVKSGYGLSILAGIAVSLVWLPFMITQLVHIQGGGFWIKAVNLNTFPNLVSNMYTYKDSSEATGWLALVVLVLFAASVYGVGLAYKAMKPKEKQAYSLLLSSAVVPPVLLFLASMPPLRSSFVDRYLLPSIFMWMIVVAIAATQLLSVRSRVWLARSISITTVAVLLVGLVNAIGAGNTNKDNGGSHTMRTAMQMIKNKSSTSEPILADSSWRYYEASFYEQLPQRVYFRSEDDTKIGAYEMLRNEVDNKITDLAAFGREHKITWFITAQPRHTESRTPKDWRTLKTYLVEGSRELRVVKMEYTGQ